MSRIGRMPITIPSGVDVTIAGSEITVKGPKGTLTHTVVEPISIERQDDGTLVVTRPDDERDSRSSSGRVTSTWPSSMLTSMGRATVSESSPLGPLTATSWPSTVMVTPAGMSMGRRPIRDMSDHHT